MKNLFDYINYLQLQKPVVIRLVTKPYKKADAEYRPRYSNSGKLKSHDIWVYLTNNTREFNSLLAHELIHAWQAENNVTEIHGKYFQKYAKKMEKDFLLQNIYIPNIDT
jgi:hypothetical protein